MQNPPYHHSDHHRDYHRYQHHYYNQQSNTSAARCQPCQPILLSTRLELREVLVGPANKKRVFETSSNRSGWWNSRSNGSVRKSHFSCLGFWVAKELYGIGCFTLRELIRLRAPINANNEEGFVILKWWEQPSITLEICQKFYTTIFLDQKFYTLKTRISGLFSLTINQRKCINISNFILFGVMIYMNE